MTSDPAPLRPAPDAPKRLLALSGGGVRGIVEVAFLEAIEAEYQRRHGAHVRLSDVFDLVGGTSTGALLATAIALGQPMSEVADFYLNRAAQFFSRRKWWRAGRGPLFDCDALEAEIRADVGDLTLGDPALRCHLAILSKRLDTGSPWILTNIPSSPYFDDPADGSYIGNRHYELALVLRAATAAPTYFSPQVLVIIKGAPPGVFVDGGLSPHSDPAMALLMLARMQAFGLNWPLGAPQMSILSLGCGRFRSRFEATAGQRFNPIWTAYRAMRGMVADMELHTLTQMEWMGQSTRPSYINSEIGHVGAETLTDAPLFRFERLDLPLERAGLADFGVNLTEERVQELQSMGDPDIIDPLYKITKRYIETLDLPALLV